MPIMAADIIACETFVMSNSTGGGDADDDDDDDAPADDGVSDEKRDACCAALRASLRCFDGAVSQKDTVEAFLRKRFTASTQRAQCPQPAP